MMIFSTLFDYNYLSRGLALYESLKKVCKEGFQLYILALDNLAYDYLKNINLDFVIIQSLEDIKEMYPVLIQLQQERTRAEFSWSLSSFSIQFFIRKFNLDSCTYLDSDLCFYNNPQILFDELSDTESVLITPHNYTPQYDQSFISGRYCVQFMYFKNNEDGNKVLEWWRKQCEICCSQKPIDGKFGDQKYLDDWLSKFSGIVHESKHLGCGVAPWNVQKYDIIQKDESLFVVDKITKVSLPLIFYHFHGLKQFRNMNTQKYLWNISSYDIDKDIINKIYKIYITRLLELQEKIPNILISDLQNYQKSFSKIFLETLKLSIKSIVKGFLIFRTLKLIQSREEKEIEERKIKYIEL